MAEKVPNFYETWNQSVAHAVPLALKKWELDQQNEKWQQQLDETKKVHNETMAMKHLELFKTTGDPVHLKAYANSMQQAGLAPPEGYMGMTPAPEASIKKQALEGITGIRGDIKTLLASKKPGERMTYEEGFDLMAKHFPEKLPELMTKEHAIEYKDKLADLKLKLGEMYSDDKRWIAMLKLVQANNKESDKPLAPSVSNAIDSEVGKYYLADPSIGPSIQERHTKAQMTQGANVSLTETGLLPHQKQAFLEIKELASTLMQQKKAKTVPDAVKQAISTYSKVTGGTSEAGGTGGFAWDGKKLVPK